MFWINAYISAMLSTLKMGFPSPQRKIRNHFLIEIPPQNLHSTHLEQLLTTLKCCFGYPLIFGGFDVIMKTLECQFSKICLIKKFHQWYLGKPHGKSCRVYSGIAQIAIAPPPFTQTGTLGHFISGPTWANHLMPFELQFSLHKCPKPSRQGSIPPKNKKMPLWTWTILL